MYIYNITTKVDWSIHEDWRAWMEETHMPAVLGTGCFDRHQFVRVLDIDETDGPTYAIQYYTSTMARYNHYINAHAPVLRQATNAKWGERVISFRSLMEIVD